MRRILTLALAAVALPAAAHPGHGLEAAVLRRVWRTPSPVWITSSLCWLRDFWWHA